MYPGIGVACSGTITIAVRWHSYSTAQYTGSCIASASLVEFLAAYGDHLKASSTAAEMREAGEGAAVRPCLHHDVKDPSVFISQKAHFRGRGIMLRCMHDELWHSTPNDGTCGNKLPSGVANSSVATFRVTSCTSQGTRCRQTQSIPSRNTDPVHGQSYLPSGDSRIIRAMLSPWQCKSEARQLYEALDLSGR